MLGGAGSMQFSKFVHDCRKKRQRAQAALDSFHDVVRGQDSKQCDVHAVFSSVATMCVRGAGVP